MEDLKLKCEEALAREDSRVAAELEENYQRTLKKELELRSLTGHLKLKVARGNQTIFAACTYKFLEMHDLVKLLQLSKEFRIEVLGCNPSVFVTKLYCARIGQMSLRIKEWTTRNQELTRQLTLHEAKDKARNSLLQNVND